MVSSHQNWKFGWNWNNVTEKLEVCVCRKVLMWWKSWKFEEKVRTKLGPNRVRPCLVPNFFFKLSTFPSHQNFSTHINFQLFHHIVLISTKLPILAWTKHTLWIIFGPCVITVVLREKKLYKFLARQINYICLKV